MFVNKNNAYGASSISFTIVYSSQRKKNPTIPLATGKQQL